MSDIDRRTTIQRLEYIKSMEWRDWAKDALQFAINSLEVDEAYQLEYEQTTKNDLGVRLIAKSDVDRIIDCPYFRQADKLIQIMNLPSVTCRHYENKDEVIAMLNDLADEISSLTMDNDPLDIADYIREKINTLKEQENGND